MKLSAPPPPPPEPPEQPDPQPNPPEPTAPENTPAAEKPPAKLATWPGWFGGVDAAIALLAVVFAFLMASFAARNTDLWVHLATGRMLLSGEYKFGSDPFSFTGAGRTWVNHSWLFDLGAYLLYSGTGFTLVLLKAITVAVAAVLLLAIRRPNHALWPWAACVVLFVLAAAPRLFLSPLVGSILFLTITLFTLFQVPAKRVPLVVGITFWLWANVDSWFILGPLALVLLLVGELIQQKFLKKDGEQPDSDEPLRTLPDVPTLAKALVVGVIACMLNPHHVRVWEVPFELVGSPAVKGDIDFTWVTLLSPTDGIYLERADLGYNPSGLAYAILLVGGGIVLGFGVGRLRVAHLVLWVGFAVLSLLSAAAIPFFAAVAVPLIAGQLNAISARVKLGLASSPGTRLMVTASASGRLLSFVALLVLCACAWPGWLHPRGNEPAATRRVAWVVEPEPSLVKATEQLRTWREKGELSPDAHGIILSIPFANHCAWFAPGEKVFINARYKHHSEELADYERMRFSLGLRTRDGPPDPLEVGEVLTKYKAEYLAYHDAFRRFGPPATQRLLASYDNWSPWYTDGRSAVFGWRTSPDTATPSYEKLRIDTAMLAVGPSVARLPVGKVQPLPLPREWADDFVRPLRPRAPEVDEVFGWLAFKQSREDTYNTQQQIGAYLFLQTPSTQGYSFHQYITEFAARRGYIGSAPPRNDAFTMAPILALRAARRAIAANPDHPDGYFALALVLQDQALPMPDMERQLGIITACRQCLSRLPSPAELRQLLKDYNKRMPYIASPAAVSRMLALMYLNPTNDGTMRGVTLDDPIRVFAGSPIVNSQRQLLGFRFLPLDIIRPLLLQAAEYVEIEAASGDPEEQKKTAESLKTLTRLVEDQLRGRNDQFRREQGQAIKIVERYQRAKQLELPGEALAIVKGMKGEELIKEFGPALIQVLLEIASIELCLGRLEDAAADLTVLKEDFSELTRNLEPLVRNNMQKAMRAIEYQKLLLEGDYTAAGSELEGLAGKDVGLGKILAELEKQKFNAKPYQALGVAWPIIPMLGSASSFEVISNYWGGFIQHEQYRIIREVLAQKLQDDATFFFRRGFLSLVEGDIAAAKDRFQQSRRTAPPEWKLPPMMHSSASNYLRIIEATEKKK